MVNMIKTIKKHLRTLVQIGFTALTNGYAAGFANGTIYRGPSKSICLPGLNCYSCPGALGACPIGSLQSVLSSRNYQFSFYVVGFLIFIGAVFGRLVCGWLCPFGLVQDLLYKIPFPVKRKKLPGDRILKYLKYIILAGFVILLPLTVLDVVGQGQPWFCKYICPSGTLFAGLPLIGANPLLRSALGWLFTWKFALLTVYWSCPSWYTGPSATTFVLWAQFTACFTPFRCTVTRWTLLPAPAAANARKPANSIFRFIKRPTVLNASAAENV